MIIVETRECPFCLGFCKLTISKTTVVYKLEVYTLDQYFYKCNECKEEFTDDITDTKTLSQIPGSIWEKDWKENYEQ